MKKPFLLLSLAFALTFTAADSAHAGNKKRAKRRERRQLLEVLRTYEP